MIIYNVTSQVDKKVHLDWLKWMQQIYIPSVLATGCFHTCRISRLLDQDESEAMTYVVQYETANRENYEEFTARYADEKENLLQETWGARLVSFRTLMEVIN